MTITKLSYLLIVANDYPPYVWGEQQRKWFTEYCDACASYWMEAFSRLYHTEVEIKYVFECPNTSYPTLSGASKSYWAQSSLKVFAESARESPTKHNGLVLLSQHLAYYEINNPSLSNRVGNSFPLEHWAYVKYLPMRTDVALYLWKSLIGLSHEWLHLVLYDMGNIPLDTGRIDQPPYRTATETTEYWVNGKIPVQSLEPS